MSTMVCTVCDGNITDKAMKAGDKLYHEEHFTCCLCGTSLAGPGVATYTKHEKLYCHDDYMQQFVPVCAKCNDYITQVYSSYFLFTTKQAHNASKSRYANNTLKYNTLI